MSNLTRLNIWAAFQWTTLNEGFDFEDADIGEKIGGWNSWIESKGSSGTLDSEFTLGKENDGNKVAVIERTAASTNASKNYQVKKSVNIGYGTERIGIGFRIKSMDSDNGNFQLIIETDNGYTVRHTIKTFRKDRYLIDLVQVFFRFKS